MRIGNHNLTELRDLAEKAATVAAAYEAGIFRGLLEGPVTDRALADALGLDGRATRIILPVLAEMGLLERSGDRFSLTEETRAHLADPESPDFEAGGLPLWLSNLRSFTELPHVLEHGGPAPGADADGSSRDESGQEDRDQNGTDQEGADQEGADQEGADQEDTDHEDTDEQQLARFMAGMAAAPAERIHRIVDTCLERHPDAATALDLGGGPGHMARAFVERGLEVTLYDRPDTVDFVAREYELTDVDGLRLARGDFTEDPLPEGPFDIVLVSNVVHIYGPDANRDLLERVARVTAPEGLVAVGEFIRGRSPRAARFALVMLLNTEEGDTYTEEEIAGWLAEAGLDAPETVDVDADRQLLTAVKRGG